MALWIVAAGFYRQVWMILSLFEQRLAVDNLGPTLVMLE